MSIIVDKKVKELGVRVCFVVFEKVHIARLNSELEKLKEELIKEVVSSWDEKRIASDPVLRGYWELHQEVHPKPERVISSPEHLIRFILEKKILPTINTLVDTYNLVSAKTLLALGAHDTDKVEGDFRLTLTTGKEHFLPLGRNGPEKIVPGVYAYIDDNDILCYLEYKQVEKTKVTLETKNVVLIVQGNSATPYELVLAGAEQAKHLIEKFCGGEGKIMEKIIL